MAKINKLRLILFLSDSLVIGVSLFLAYILRQGVFIYWYDPIQPWLVYFYLWGASILFFYFLANLKSINNWRLVFDYRINRYLLQVWQVVLYFGLFIMSLSYLIKYDFSRIVILSWWLMLLFFIPLARIILRKILARWFVLDFLIIGDNEISRRLAKSLTTDFIISSKIKIINHLPPFLKKNYYEVIVVDSDLTESDIFLWFRKHSDHFVRLSLVLNLFPKIFSDPSLHLDYDSFPRLGFHPPSSFYRISKRLVDLILTTLLLILSLPIMILIFFFIWFKSKRWPIIGLWRIGYQGKMFKMYKFLTMKGVVKEATSPQNLTDPRVYSWGRWLRRSSLDELPQFLNVLKGEMSLVGPRPEMQMEVKRYRKWQKIRLEAKPGISGLWQILGRKDLPLKKNLEYDLYYVANRNLWFDLWILLRTPLAVLSGRGAY